MNDSNAAIPHTTVFSRAVGIPSIAARSVRSAVALIAVPSRLRLRNHATPAMQIGPTIRAIRWLALRITGPIVHVQSSGGAIRSLARLRPHQRGTRIPSTTRSWLMPRVATVTTSRGEWRNRRTIPSSTTTPSATAITSPSPSPTRYGRPQNRMKAAAKPVGT